MNSRQIKEIINITDLLLRLGYKPSFNKGYNFWYKSMLREEEKTESFVVNSIKNVWFDHGLGIGGNIIDLGIKLFKTSNISIVIKRIEETISANSLAYNKIQFTDRVKQEAKIEVKKIEKLNDLTLLNYLQNRGISKKLAIQYCVQYRYVNASREFVSIGFKNENGGAELRSTAFKSCISPKAITLIKNKGSGLIVFEGFIDFLSYLSIKEIKIENTDYLILNSVSMLSKAYEVIEKYHKVYLMLDNDKTGQEAVDSFKRRHPIVIDMSLIYHGYKDLNDYLVQNFI